MQTGIEAAALAGCLALVSAAGIVERFLDDLAHARLDRGDRLGFVRHRVLDCGAIYRSAARTGMQVREARGTVA